jgi:ketosteroid isomerase-like protein
MGRRRRAATEAWNTGALNRVPEFVAADAVDHSRVDGQAADPEDWNQRRQALRAAIPDLQVSVERVVATGDTVGRLLKSRGTRAGQPFEAFGMDIVRVRDGKIVEHWAVSEPWGVEPPAS